MGRRMFTHAGVFASVAVVVAIASYRSSGSIAASLLSGVLASSVATLGVIALDRKAAGRMASHGLSDGDYPVRVAVIVTVTCKPAMAVGVCRDAVESLPRFGSVRDFDAGRGFCARTRRSAESWGEKITVSAKPVDNGTRLHLKSVPVLWTVTEDMRLNFQNVALIARHLDARLAIGNLAPHEYYAAILGHEVNPLHQG